jgi:hypothetical protein
VAKTVSPTPTQNLTRERLPSPLPLGEEDMARQVVDLKVHIPKCKMQQHIAKTEYAQLAFKRKKKMSC